MRRSTLNRPLICLLYFNALLDLDPPLNKADIIAERVGVRPLATRSKEADADWVKLSRKHVIESDEAARSEMIIKLEDFMRRRSRIEQVVRNEEIQKAPALTKACDILFGEDAEQRYREYLDNLTPGGLCHLCMLKLVPASDGGQIPPYGYTSRAWLNRKN